MSAELTTRPISVARVVAALADPPSGGVVLFLGRVRADRVGGRTVRALFYEADPTVAARRFAALEREAVRRYGARKVRVVHRVGRLPVGAVSVVVGVAAPHRAPAFAAARFLIERLKREVPVWKTERTGRAPRARRRRPPPRRRGGRRSG